MSIETVKLEPGKAVKPFENHEKFLPVDFEEFFSHNLIGSTPMTVLSADIDFDGIPGSIALSVNNNITNRSNHSEPLGSVKLDIDFRRGQTRIKEVPLNLSIIFQMESPEKFDNLMKYIPAFNLSEEKYYVIYHHESIQISPERMREKILDWKCLPVIGVNLTKAEDYFKTRCYIDVLLPYNLNQVSEGVELTMLEKPQTLALAS